MILVFAGSAFLIVYLKRKSWESISPTHHRQVCVCGDEIISSHVISGDYYTPWSDILSDYDRNAHAIRCALCGYEEINGHTFSNETWHLLDWDTYLEALNAWNNQEIIGTCWSLSCIYCSTAVGLSIAAHNSNGDSLVNYLGGHRAVINDWAPYSSAECYRTIICNSDACAADNPQWNNVTQVWEYEYNPISVCGKVLYKETKPHNFIDGICADCGEAELPLPAPVPSPAPPLPLPPAPAPGMMMSVFLDEEDEEDAGDAGGPDELGLPGDVNMLDDALPPEEDDAPGQPDEPEEEADGPAKDEGSGQTDELEAVGFNEDDEQTDSIP